MIAEINHLSKKYTIDLSDPIDISIAMQSSKNNVNAWYVDPPKIEPHKDGDWVASVAEGASINFNNIEFNPHSHVTHTECVGHITKNVHSINSQLKTYFHLAELVTIAPLFHNDDFLIGVKQLEKALRNKSPEAIVIRTIPNLADKKSMQYSNTNPTYLSEKAAIFLRDKGIQHLLIDVPSVDKEKDNGMLLSHNAFWNTNGKIRMNATITEFIYVPNTVEDGTYFLNLMIAPFVNDATPSKPILYKILE